MAIRPALLHCFWHLLLLHQIWLRARGLGGTSSLGTWAEGDPLRALRRGGGLVPREGALHPEPVPGMLGAGALAVPSRVCVQTEVCSAPGRGAVNPHHRPGGFRGEGESARGREQWDAVPVRDGWT